MTPHVMKRDGCKVPFKSERIKEAILRAAKAAEVDDADYCATVAAVVSEQMQGRNQVDINEIQTAVENQLMSGPYKQLARAYIEYRHDRDIEREKRGRLNQEIRGLVEQTNSSLLNENANKDSKVVPTQRDLLAGSIRVVIAQITSFQSRALTSSSQTITNLVYINWRKNDQTPIMTRFACPAYCFLIVTTARR